MIKETWIVWNEPWMEVEGKILKSVMRVKEADAIKFMRSKHPYESDERAVEDFIAVNWAWKEEREEI